MIVQEPIRTKERRLLVCCTFYFIFDVLVLSSLSYEKSQTLFRVGQPPFSPIMREIPLTNQFDIPVVLYDVRLPFKAQEYFTVSLNRIHNYHHIWYGR